MYSEEKVASIKKFSQTPKYKEFIEQIKKERDDYEARIFEAQKQARKERWNSTNPLLRFSLQDKNDTVVEWLDRVLDNIGDGEGSEIVREHIELRRRANRSRILRSVGDEQALLSSVDMLRLEFGLRDVFIPKDPEDPEDFGQELNLLIGQYTTPDEPESDKKYDPYAEEVKVS